MLQTEGSQFMSGSFYLPMQDSGAEVTTISSGGTEASHGSPTSETHDTAHNSIRVTWTVEDKELYRDILRKHGRSMMHLCAAFPMK